MRKIGQVLFALVLVIGALLPFQTLASAASITVAEAIASNTGTATVEGYIVGFALSGSNYTTDPERYKNTNIGIADEAGETDPAKIMPVQLTTSFRTGINLAENPDNLGKKVQVTGSLEPYFTVPGLKSPTSVVLLDDDGIEEPEEPVDIVKESISAVRQKAEGTDVWTSGTVTAVFGNNVYIQDETAGIVLYGSGTNVAVGDIIEAKGKMDDYNSLLEIAVQADGVTVTGSGDMPASSTVTAADLTEAAEGTLVKINNVSVASFSGGNYTAADKDGNEFQIRPQDAALVAVNTNYDSITGVVGSYNNVYQLIPRGTEDIEADSSTVQAVTANPAAGVVEAGTGVSLASPTEGAEIRYTLDGSEPAKESTLFSDPIVIDENKKIKAKAFKDGLADSTVSEFTYVIQKDIVRIHDIQGVGHTSPYSNLAVENVEGVVTHIVDSSNFYMQSVEADNDENTSEGILVYKQAHGLSKGDLVSVNGTVKEWVLEGYSEKLQTDLPVTEINASLITKKETSYVLPKPVIVNEDRMMPTEVIDNDQLGTFDPAQDGIDFFESVEGMLIQVNNPKVVAPQNYGEVVVVPNNIETNTTAGALRITADDYNPERIHLDLNDEDFVAKTGDSFNGNVTGVVSYGYSNFKVLVDEVPELNDGGLTGEETTLTATEDGLTIASYNLENFSTASGADKTNRLAAGIVNGMKSPDIIGVTEVQDNDGPADSGTTDASESAAALIAAIEALGGPTYVYTDVAPADKMDGGQPGGNIRVGFLYNPERVSLAEGTKGTATEAAAYVDGKLTLNPGRIDPDNAAFEDSRKPVAAQFTFNGEKVIVVANHFNSKGGDEPLFGKNQPPYLGSEVQRKQIAAVVNGFVQDVKTADPDANVVLVGDFNDFEFTESLSILKGSELTNMIEKVPADERFTYSYQGNAQVLDHILVTNNMAPSTEVDIAHMNSQFMEEHGRASDHDPVVIRTTFADDVVEEDIVYVPALKKKQFVVAKPGIHLEFDKGARFSKGIVVKHSATLQGAGLKHNTVIISTPQKGQVIDLRGAEVKEVQIDTKQEVEIIGVQNVKKWIDSEGEETQKPAA
ncbi:DUF6359 domain-containing protein [Domibacillus sp. A3M-37]|uniref:DUF6359 domain-containing protein n=1 Tax=Domibacillus sp. A3M-37 TaxID=2962037 RepID=UPI0020B8BFF0|nr:DUF6359 domain-containing protein [Domibacillus sp. A3M-37]MCP3760817.1 DUF6359 domain-containing protein [Domibacillus sp. A3M-37]